MTRVLYIVFALLLALLGLAFHVRNNQQIQFDYFMGVVNIDLSWLVVGSLAIGVLLGLLVMLGKVMLLRHQVRSLTRSNERANRELGGLRAIALKDGG